MIRKLLLLVPFAAALGCGEPLLHAGARAERVCVRKAGETLPGTGASLASGSISDEFPVKLGDFPEGQDDALALSLDLLSFRISANGANPDALDGIEELRVQLTAPGGSGMEPIVLVDFPADPAGVVRGADGEFFVDGAALRRSLLAYLDGEAVTLSVNAKGTLPQSEWAADIELCVAADGEYDYGRSLGL